MGKKQDDIIVARDKRRLIVSGTGEDGKGRALSVHVPQDRKYSREELRDMALSAFHDIRSPSNLSRTDLEEPRFILRKCRRCGELFPVPKRRGTKGAREKLPEYIEMRRTTPYSNQKICPYCKDLEHTREGKGGIHTRVCDVCQKAFRSTRNDAKTCSPACRQRLSRKKKRKPIG